MNIHKQTLIVISSPSGGGKNTLIQALLNKRTDMVHCISTTTRKPRKGEEAGIDYYFIAKSEFEKQIKKDAFLEWARVLDNYYGTSLEEVERIRKEGKIPILDIDIQGAFQLKEKNPYTCLIFIIPPSLEELEKRLRLRGTETEEEIRKRMELAHEEIKAAKDYDHIIINDSIQDAILQLENTIDELY